MKNCFKLFRLVKIKSDKYCQERRFLWEDWEILKWNFLFPCGYVNWYTYCGKQSYYLEN